MSIDDRRWDSSGDPGQGAGTLGSFPRGPLLRGLMNPMNSRQFSEEEE